MIKDRLENAKIYYGLSERIKKGFDWLINTDFTQIQDGRYEIDERLYANVQTYNTKEDALFEAHREYIDIQYILKGEEKIGIVNYNNCKSEIPYKIEKDIEFLNSADGEWISLKEGEFMILYPQDAHKPSINLHEKSKVKKVVVKVGI